MMSYVEFSMAMGIPERFIHLLRRLWAETRLLDRKAKGQSGAEDILTLLGIYQNAHG
jgi:hypothetical protein